MLKVFHTGLLSLLCFIAAAQQIPRDTSFNLRADYEKNIKRFPHIKPVLPLGKGVDARLDIVYSNVQGRTLCLDVYAPEGIKTSYPVVIMIHGGGWRSGTKEMMAGFASQLADRGYIVVVPEYRLSLEATYPTGINDLKEVIKWCYNNRRTYRFDMKKLSVLGTSSGAQMASLLGNNIAAKHRVSATINIDGVLAFRHPESAEGAMAAQWLGGTYEEKPSVWLEASPLYHVNKRTAPTLFIGSATPRFQAGRTDMIQRLDSLGGYSDVLVLEDAPHTFWFYEPWFTPMLEKIDEFLTFKRK